MFYNSTTGKSPDMVFGMYYCRGDIDLPFCHDCVKLATKIIAVNCTTKEAVIIYPQCTLWYAERPLAALADQSLFFDWYISNANVTHFDKLEQVLSSTMRSLFQKAAYSDTYEGYVTGEIAVPPYLPLYCLVQCPPNMLGATCDTCLKTAFTDLQSCCKGKLWAYIFRKNCQLSYDIVRYYKDPAPPSNLLGSLSRERIRYYLIRVVVPAVCLVILILLSAAVYVYMIKRKEQRKPPGTLSDEKHNITESLLFSLETMKSATGNFSDANKLGEGGFGAIYKGKLPDGHEVAVKRLLEESRQGLKEFSNEVQLVAKLQHRNLVKLLGFCSDGEEKLLVYEFVSNMSLDRFLFDQHKRKILNWEKRVKIIVGIARGLLYLHEDSRLKIIHRDLKSSNILLDEEMNPKIADFGIARLVKVDQTHTSTTKISGTFGYMAPEYATTGVFSTKSDVYSFGIILLEIISGQSNFLFSRLVDEDSLISHSWRLWNAGAIMELVDPSLGNNFSKTEVLRCIQVGLFCVQEEAARRPTMASVVLLLNSNSIDFSSLRGPTLTSSIMNIPDVTGPTSVG